METTMQAQASAAYAAVAQLWSSVYDAPPPPGSDAGDILQALIGAIEPLAYDQFYEPFVDVEEAPAAEAAAEEAPIPSPARMRALDVALRDMLRACPVSDALRSLVTQIEDATVPAPVLRLDGVDG